MLVITYDEHGGFYDHVPPPGTPLGDPQWRGGLPKIHPDGESFLGPRVPTFVVSPRVEAGSVSHTLFDHTSLVKTILVRHRHKFRQNVFGLFGERVPVMNHLGAALNRTAPRRDIALAAPVPPRTPANFGDTRHPRFTLEALPPEARHDPEQVPYGFSLARATLPQVISG